MLMSKQKEKNNNIRPGKNQREGEGGRGRPVLDVNLDSLDLKKGLNHLKVAIGGSAKKQEKQT